MKLAKYMGEYKLHSILTPIFVVFEVFLEVLIPFLMSEIIDNGIEASNLGYTIKMGLLLVVFALLALLVWCPFLGILPASAHLDMLKISEKRFFIKYRGTPLPILTSFQLPALSPG